MHPLPLARRLLIVLAALVMGAYWAWLSRRSLRKQEVEYRWVFGNGTCSRRDYPWLYWMVVSLWAAFAAFSFFAAAAIAIPALD